VLDMALNDLWVQSTLRRADEGRAYAASDYFRQLDGLRFKEIVALTDPSGEKRKQWYAVANALRRPTVQHAG
jgi:hypothetical protein